MDNTSNAHAALHNARQGLVSLAKAVYLLLVVIPATGVDAALPYAAWFVSITAVAFWAGYDRADAAALASTARNAWRPESWIVIAVGGAIWLAWSAVRRRLDTMA